MKASIALAERVKKVIEQKDITKSELIKKSKLSPSTINNILQGKSDKVLISTLCVIMKALDVSLSEFFDDDLLTLENIEDTSKRSAK
ncbi:XRE family transcriptional regulator [Candidatus Borkfalkia ceftriaxoniphila]|uniref:XRE family transcriptional regulator n=1 Tax=Candidatus Borkfalkia ceftriaxoniphila TaxID=2508949 RepID=A0A4V1QVT9_9FIRM|nr:helix-turn-helix transcriptional regulator [Candidatus Borkfalkia ceftriaxoniphila]RXZ63816.1 XRE family transcriptional regulator [Candidatus Borkfalkia ceftriaxoniphila]